MLRFLYKNIQKYITIIIIIIKLNLKKVTQ